MESRYCDGSNVTAPVYADDDFGLFHADCLEVLALLADDSVDSIVCDPPYELGFMGKSWDNKGIAYDVSMWKECLRVLKPGGHLAAFGGTRTYHRMACAIEDAGFEVRDSLHWIYGSGFPKGLNVSHAIDQALSGEKIDPPVSTEGAQWEGWNVALKPAHEPIVLARKPLSEKTVAANVLKHGTGAMNIDGCRVAGSANSRKGGDLSNRATALEGGDRIRTDYQPDTAGRWPPNILLSHSAACVPAGEKKVPGSRADRSEATNGIASGVLQGGVDGSLNQVQSPGYADADGMETVLAWTCADDCPVAEMDRQSGTLKSGAWNGVVNKAIASQSSKGGEDVRVREDRQADAGGASRFFPQFEPDYDFPYLYCAKAPKKERPKAEGAQAHPTVKPLSLMRWLVRLVTPPHGVVLDMFCGTGTTLQAARAEGFRSIGIDSWEDAIAQACARLGVEREHDEEPDYCEQCDHDTHACPGCGIPLAHGASACDGCSDPAVPGSDEAVIQCSSAPADGVLPF
jgi:site-specific DNA-methyltransferase (adenine-specific)